MQSLFHALDTRCLRLGGVVGNLAAANGAADRQSHLAAADRSANCAVSSQGCIPWNALSFMTLGV